MERWSGRVAMVTGASAGIGAAIACELVRKGMKVVGLARRVDRMKALEEDLKDAPGKLYPVQCDITREEDVIAAFAWVDENLGAVDVLVNNAGVGRTNLGLVDSPTAAWRNTLEINVLALSVCTREAIKSMRAHGVDDGHVIHINSVAGHTVSDLPFVGMYAASKHAVTVVAEALRKELNALKSRIRVTSISPGLVRTEIILASGRHNSLEFFDRVDCLEAKDIADAAIYVLGAPPHVLIRELTIKPISEVNV